MNDKSKVYDVLIVGSGPAGLTSGIYTTRANLTTLMLAGAKWGGQLMLTSEVENYPGFPEGVQGPQLMMQMRMQAEKHGTVVVDANFVSADYSKRPFVVQDSNGDSHTARSIIIATGADTKWLEVPGERERIGRGISSCAPCDAAFYREKNVIVVGGGDSAMEEALVLTKFAKHVFVMHRRDSFRASKVMADRVLSHPKITVLWNSAISEIKGNEKVESVIVNTVGPVIKARESGEDGEKTTQELGGKTIKDKGDNLEWEMPIDGVFVAIGHIPNSTVFKGIDVDDKGFIKIGEHSKTNIEGVFVGGDVHDHKYKQAITAAAFGCMAAMDVEKWLDGQVQ